MTNDELAQEVALGIVKTGIEGGFDSVSCSTAGDYPSMGVSQWEGIDGRGDELLSWIPGGDEFRGRSYSDIESSGELQNLRDLLGSDAGQGAQMSILTRDCRDKYVDYIAGITATAPDGSTVEFNDSRCVIYACMWCPTSDEVVHDFIEHRIERGYDVNDLNALSNLFYDQYTDAAGVGERYRAGYENRSIATYNYVASLDLSAYDVPAYGNQEG